MEIHISSEGFDAHSSVAYVAVVAAESLASFEGPILVAAVAVPLDAILGVLLPLKWENKSIIGCEGTE